MNLLIKILSISFSLFSVSYSACDKDYEVVCYWASWSYYRVDVGQFTTNDIDPSLCTTIIYSFFGLDENLNLNHLDTWVDKDKHGLTNITALKTDNPCLKVNLAVGGWNEGSLKYSVMAATEEGRKSFAKQVLKVLAFYGFDGVDIDWEYPTTRGGISQDKDNLVALLLEIKNTITSWNLELTLTTAAIDDVIDAAYDIPRLVSIVDHVHIMAYDYTTEVSGVTGLSAPLSAINKSVQHWIGNGFPSKKLIVGIPAYARTFTLADKTKHGIGDKSLKYGQKGDYTNEDGYLAYYEVLESEDMLEYIEVEADGTIYAYNDTDWLTYDNPNTLKKKAKYVKELKLGGIMIWSIDTDDFNGSFGKKYPLLNAINEELMTN